MQTVKGNSIRQTGRRLPGIGGAKRRAVIGIRRQHHIIGIRPVFERAERDLQTRYVRRQMLAVKRSVVVELYYITSPRYSSAILYAKRHSLFIIQRQKNLCRSRLP